MPGQLRDAGDGAEIRAPFLMGGESAVRGETAECVREPVG